MKKLLAILAVLILTASFASAATIDPWSGGNCTATATGHFTFTVEPAIAITVGNDIDLGGICPGCFKTYTQANCLLWTITGGKDCKFLATETSTLLPAPTGTVIIANGWAYGTNNSTWTTVTFPYTGDPFTFSQPTGSYNGVAYFRDCINRIDVDCYTAPGLYTITHTVEVDYTCPGRIG
jgi:hypothetical protein